VRTHRYILIGALAISVCLRTNLRAAAQDPLFGSGPPLDIDVAAIDPAAPPPAATPPASAPSAIITPLGASDAANIDGCQVIARIDGQIVQACEVLWHVNKIIEQNKDRIPAGQENQLRQELIKKELASMLDRKLVYAEFLRNVPAENLPHIQEKLQEPFQEREVPLLMKQLEVKSPLELEREITRLGSSVGDVREAFNERVIMGEWIRTKIKVSEEVSPDEMIQFYQTHLSNYEEPLRVRWEELIVRKSRFASAAEAYAQIANMGNEVWQRFAARPNARGPAFAEVAMAKSDGYRAKEDGGQHDWTIKGSIKLTVIDEALFSLQVGADEPDPRDGRCVLHCPRAGAQGGGPQAIHGSAGQDSRRPEGRTVPHES
jgi:hypothetical protein